MTSFLGPEYRPARLPHILAHAHPYWKRRHITRMQFVYTALVWIAGSFALAGTTWVCFQSHVDISTASLILRLVVVVLALFNSFFSSIFFAILGATLLDYFFTKPLFHLNVYRREDVIALLTFTITTLVVSALIRYIRLLGNVQREQARLLDLTNDNIFVRDDGDIIRYWNHAAESLYGWKRSEAIGRHAHTLLATVFPCSLEEINRVLIHTGHWEGELVHTTRDGAKLVLASRWSVQIDANGKLCAILESNTDITRRKQAEEALRRSEAEFLAEAQRLSQTGSFAWNTQTSAVSWSAQTFRIFEYDATVSPSIELFFARLHPEDATSARFAFATAVAAKRHLDLDTRLLMPDGAIKHVHVVAHALEAAPAGVQYIGAVMDVSAARRAEEQIRSTQAELERISRATVLGVLSASIAHEVGQPLAAIMTFGQTAQRWIVREPPELDEVHGCLDGVIASAMRASSIVQRVRDMTSRTTAQRELLNLDDVVDEMAPLLSWEISRHGIELQFKLAQNLPPILANRIQLQQVLMNLLVNAMQAMSGSAGGQRGILVESRLDESGHVTVAVRDSGPGIREEDAQRLFEAFYTTKSTGMGMGLSICRSIVVSHCGRIWAANNADCGATFSFSLPPARKPAAQETGDKTCPPAP
ncbi:ATP-binding protein [Paraburkholderia silviterrae]|uniref:histidine kinase n=1 Tax=Paraburkholderia silviterrae TaxID=2528715 RepID=A0A4R5M0U5_9BURK|nr:ATP-binding protein [Paraburkholderia silviterrae]TDG18830.1 DUF4118 domain-containing protein [Paraburkholderia silviterrae]